MAIEGDCVRKNPFDFQLSEVIEDDSKPKVCGVITFGNATFCVLLYFLTSPRNILS